MLHQPTRRCCHVMAPLVREVLVQCGFEARVQAVEMRVTSRGRGEGFAFFLGEHDEHPDNFHLVVGVDEWLIDPTAGQIRESVRVVLPDWSRSENRKYLRDFPDWLIGPNSADTGLQLKRVIISYEPRPERQYAWQHHTREMLPTEVGDRLVGLALRRIGTGGDGIKDTLVA